MADVNHQLPHLEGKLLHLHATGYFGGRTWLEKFVIVIRNVLVVSESEEDYEKQNYSILIDLLDVQVYATSILGSSKRNVFKLSTDRVENTFACDSWEDCSRWSVGLLVLKNHWRISLQYHRRTECSEVFFDDVEGGDYTDVSILERNAGETGDRASGADKNYLIKSGAPANLQSKAPDAHTQSNQIRFQSSLKSSLTKIFDRQRSIPESSSGSESPRYPSDAPQHWWRRSSESSSESEEVSSDFSANVNWWRKMEDYFGYESGDDKKDDTDMIRDEDSDSIEFSPMYYAEKDSDEKVTANVDTQMCHSESLKAGISVDDQCRHTDEYSNAQKREKTVRPVFSNNENRLNSEIWKGMNDEFSNGMEKLTTNFRASYIDPLQVTIGNIQKFFITDDEDCSSRFTNEPGTLDGAQHVLSGDDTKAPDIGWIVRNQFCNAMAKLLSFGASNHNTSLWCIVKEVSLAYKRPVFHSIVKDIEINDYFLLNDNMKFRFFVCQLLNSSTKQNERMDKLLVTWFQQFPSDHEIMRRFYKESSFWTLCLVDSRLNEFYQEIVESLRKLNSYHFRLHVYFELENFRKT